MPVRTRPLSLRRPSGRARAAISLTPLIDVVFILLVFFMLASSFLDWRAIDLQTPAGGGASTEMTGALLLRIHADGQLDLNGQRIAPADLPARLRELAESRPEARLLIQPGPEVTTQRAVDVLDQARGSGITQAQFVHTAGNAQ
ncbi:ExbD/TolR family protein [Rhodovibrio salinarum]|uniref:Biopolymer transporter ExbD n=1 Tax=Rhodovibrio salinarum TaxID=1087 RepID=A0A934QJP3_9PROT|nr:biopolymer transporter ExbD [Rhodovibrio salinarum]MBK1697775.1 biopolymer transporter ExbD [Rhodovibrio salinarum]